MPRRSHVLFVASSEKSSFTETETAAREQEQVHSARRSLDGHGDSHHLMWDPRGPRTDADHGVVMLYLDIGFFARLKSLALS